VAVAINDHDTVAEDCERERVPDVDQPPYGRMLRTGLHHCQTRIGVC
jgi:hypothetical protein